MLPKATQLVNGKEKIDMSKFLIPTIILASALGLAAIIKTIAWILPDAVVYMSKDEAEARASIHLREYAECFNGNTQVANPMIYVATTSHGWQCFNAKRTAIVSCLGQDCYRVK